MKKHFKSWWGMYAIGIFMTCWITITVLAAIEDDNDKKDCISRGHYYIDHECYKSVVPE